MRVAVTGVGGGVGQSVIRALRLASIPLEIVGLDADGWGVGLYQTDFSAVIPHVADAARYLPRLAEVIRQYQVDALIPGTDTELIALADAREQLAELGCQVIVSSPEFTRVARDKVQTYRVLSQAGLPFVRTVTVADFAAAGRQLSAPMMLKRRDGSGSVGARVVFSAQDLRPEELDGRDVLQDYLLPTSWGIGELKPADVLAEGRLRQEDEVSLQAMIGPGGGLVATYVSVNVLRDGVPVRVCPTKDPGLLDFAEQMFLTFARMGHVGPCNAQGRLTEEGLVLYELNPRFTGITAVRAGMGWNECEAALRLFVRGESAAAVGQRLEYDPDIVCLRYVTEQFVPASRLLVDRADATHA